MRNKGLKIMLLATAAVAAGGYLLGHRIAADAETEHLSTKWEDRTRTDSADQLLESSRDTATQPLLSSRPASSAQRRLPEREATDLVTSVQTAITAAEQGDADAAWYLVDTLRDCMTVFAYARQGVATEEEFLSKVMRKFTPEGHKEKRREEWQRCERLARSSELVEWGKNENDKLSSGYWKRVALELGHPQAVAEWVISTIDGTGQSQSAEDEAPRVERVRAAVGDVLASGDPQALFHLGGRLLNGDVTSDPTDALATTIAACELGYDCTADNPNSSSSYCRVSGLCPDVFAWEDEIRRMYGERRYAAAYARAQEYMDLLARGSASEIRSFVTLDGPRFKK